MPLPGPMELGKIHLTKTKHYRNEKVTPSGHLAVFLYGFWLFWMSAWLCPRFPTWQTWISNSRAQQWPTWVAETSLERDLKLDISKHGPTTRQWLFHLPVPDSMETPQRTWLKNTAYPHSNIVIKYFNSIYLPKVSILYFPVCLFCFPIDFQIYLLP